MTDYWQSHARHRCALCGCWMDGKAASIRAHEDGKQHREAVDKQRAQLKQQRRREESETARLQAELARIDTEAQARIAAASTVSASSHHQSKRARTAHSSASSPSALNGTLPGPPWQTALDLSTQMTYYYHPGTKQTTWNLADTFALLETGGASDIARASFADTDSHHEGASEISVRGSVVGTADAAAETVAESAGVAAEDELDEMGLPKWRPVTDADSAADTSSSTNHDTGTKAYTHFNTSQRDTEPAMELSRRDNKRSVGVAAAIDRSAADSVSTAVRPSVSTAALFKKRRLRGTE